LIKYFRRSNVILAYTSGLLFGIAAFAAIPTWGVSLIVLAAMAMIFLAPRPLAVPRGTTVARGRQPVGFNPNIEDQSRPNRPAGYVGFAQGVVMVYRKVEDEER